jgi:hypothetical protein
MNGDRVEINVFAATPVDLDIRKPNTRVSTCVRVRFGSTLTFRIFDSRTGESVADERAWRQRIVTLWE